jgi:predicted dehydrogenase
MTNLAFGPPVPENRDRGIGLVGCGWVASMQLEAYLEAGYNVVALTDVSIEKAEALRSEYYPDATVYQDLSDLLADDRVEVVDLATHVDVRPALVERALRAGRHVLSQKPLLHYRAVAARLCALADELGLTLAVNHNGRWAPHFSVLLAAARTGTLGQITSADFSVHWPHDQVVRDMAAFATMQDLVLYDFGVHWFDVLSALIEESPVQVFAQVGQRPGQVIDAPTHAQVLVSFPHAQASLIFRAAEPRSERGAYRVDGTRGTAIHEGASLGGRKVRIITGEGEAETVYTSPTGEDWFGPGMAGTMGELLLSLDQGRAPSNSARSALLGLSLCFAATESAATGRPVVPGTVRHRPEPR